MIQLIAHVTCPYCDTKQKIDCQDFVVDESCDEREMGPECEYAIMRKAYKCDSQKCGKDFILQGSIWEYPEGTENLNEVIAIGIQDDDLDVEDNE